MFSFATGKQFGEESDIGRYGVDYLQIESNWLYTPESDTVGMTKKMVDPPYANLPAANQPFHIFHLFLEHDTKLNTWPFASAESPYRGLYVFNKPRGSVKNSIVRKTRASRTSGGSIIPHAIGEMKVAKVIQEVNFVCKDTLVEPGVCFDIEVMDDNIGGAFVVAYPCNKVDSKITFGRMLYLLNSMDYQYQRFLADPKCPMTSVFLFKEMLNNRITRTCFNSALENEQWIKKLLTTEESRVLADSYRAWVDNTLLPIRNMCVKDNTSK